MPAPHTTGLRAGDRRLRVFTVALLAAVAARPALGNDTLQYADAHGFGQSGVVSQEFNGSAMAEINLNDARNVMSAATDGVGVGETPGLYAIGQTAAPNTDGAGSDTFSATAYTATTWVLEPDQGFTNDTLSGIQSARLTATIEGVLQAEAGDPNTAFAMAWGVLGLYAGGTNTLDWSMIAENAALQENLPEGASPDLYYGFQPSNLPYEQWTWHDFGREASIDANVAPQHLSTGDFDPRTLAVGMSAQLVISGTIEHNLHDYWIRAAAKAGMTYAITAVDALGNPISDVTAYLVTPPAAIAWAGAIEADSGQLLLMVDMDESDRPEYTVPTRGESIMWFYRDTNGNGTLEEDEDELLGADNWGGDGWSLPTSYNADEAGTLRFFALAENACGVKSDFAAAEFFVEDPTPHAFGTSLANLGDLDNDGFDDMALSQPGYEGRGKVMIYSGQLMEPMFDKTGRGQGDEFGYALAGIADLNGDGIRDILIGAPYDDLAGLTDCGSVEIVSGADGSRIAIRRGAFAHEYYGYAIDAGQDLNGDGTEDFIVGAPGARRGSITYTGALYLHSGTDLSRFRRILGRGETDYLGYSVALLADFDGDGHADFAAGAPGNRDRDSFAGRFTVWSGQSGLPMFHRRGAHGWDMCGLAMSAADDLDGDGLGDLVVGTPYYDTAVGQDVGKITAWNHHGQAIWSRGGQHEYGQLGTAIERLDDLDCDGIDDIAAGAPGANIAQLFSGDDRALIGEFAPRPDQERLGYGTALAWFGGNLADDAGWLLVGAPYRDNGDVHLEFVATCGTGSLPGDLNDDGVVDVFDMAILLDNYGCIGDDCIGDINGNGFVDYADMFLMQLYLGEND